MNLGPRALMLLGVGGLVLLGVLGYLLAQVGLALNATTVSGVGGGLVVLLVVGWRSRRAPAGLPELGQEVRDLRAAVDAERLRLPASRATGASNDSIQRVLRQPDEAERNLALRGEPRAAELLAALTGLTTDWAPASPESRRAHELAAAGEHLRTRYQKDAAILRQRPPGDADGSAAEAPASSQAEAPDARRLPTAESYPSVLELLHAGDLPAATREYRTQTHLGLTDARAAVLAAAHRLNLPTGDF